jgi:tRNA/rRNA methyltransferase
MPARDNFAFVLFKPQSAGNIGAAARALKNMGFDDLRLVAPGPLNNREAVAMAVHADDVLAGATTYPDLPSALADCSVTVGTTSRRGGYRSTAQPLRAAAIELDTLSNSNRIAVIFGREDRGLTNRELKLCHRLITIPTAPEYPSLNLAQAVVVVAYELMMASSASTPRPRENLSRRPSATRCWRGWPTLSSQSVSSTSRIPTTSCLRCARSSAAVDSLRAMSKS